VLLALGLDAALASGSLRLTLDLTNRPEEIPEILRAVEESVTLLRGMQG
jgi:cysteine sulfinate desulfinase/cysteine desulfurase-like protein